MPNDGISELLNTTFVPEDIPSPASADGEFPVAHIEPLKVDASIVKAEKHEDNFDSQESMYVKEKLKTLVEKAELFFTEVRDEFKQAPTAKVAESAGKVLDSAITALEKLAEIDENMKKRKFAREKDKAKNQPPQMSAGGDIINNVQNIYANREDILKAIRREKNVTAVKIVDVEEVKENTK